MLRLGDLGSGSTGRLRAVCVATWALQLTQPALALGAGVTAFIEADE
jgi:hypothetical protein